MPHPDLDRALTKLAHTLAEADLSRSGADDADIVVVWSDRPLAAEQQNAIAAARARGAALVLLGPTLAQPAAGPWAEAAGLCIGELTAEHDVRVRPGKAAALDVTTDHGHTGLGHLGEHIHSRDRVLQVLSVAADVQVLLTASLGLAEHPVATWRPSTRVLTWSLGGTASALASRSFIRFLLTALQLVAARPAPPPVKVGLLGYGAIGHEHARAATSVPGLDLAAVCDTSSARREAAEAFTPGVRTHASPQDLLADEVDLVVVSTPPSSHAHWGLEVVRSGRHVVVEKPFAVTTAEADAVLTAAAEQDLLAVVYQNRRFDPDYLALQKKVRSGELGEIFHVESFVGGYGHPCNLWHSDEGVSGGAIYDWGAHVIDQLLDLVPGEVASVSAVTHKRRWLDVTNADHSRVTISMADGVEIQFIYSDLAAALKPRWYVLGTEGAIVGNWRTERIVARSAVGTLVEDVLSPADSPPTMDHHHGDGAVTRLALPLGEPHPFHVELADFLRLKIPMSVTGSQSRRVLSVMEAARASALAGGQPVVPQ